MEKKIVYLKLLQFVFSLAFIWQLGSLHQFCGTFADPKAFLHDISIGHCKSFTLIGKDSKSGEFGAVFDHHKWHNQLSMSSTNGRPFEEQQHHQFMDELAAKLPSAGRHCIPITFSPVDWFFDWIGLLDRNPLNNDTLFFFSLQFGYALDTSLIALCLGIRDLLLNVEEYKFWAYYIAFYSVVCWSFCVRYSQFLMNSSANAPQYQFFYFLVEKLPPAGRHCIPIMITPFDGFFEWIGILNRNPLSNGTLLHFSRLFLFALLSLGFLCYAIMEMLHSMEEYESSAYFRAFAFAFCWCCTGVDSFKLLFYWTDFWSCVNFRADHTNVPLVTLLLSIVLVCSSIFEIVLHKFVLNDVDTESANVMMISDQQQQPKKKNGSACAIE